MKKNISNFLFRSAGVIIISAFLGSCDNKKNNSDDPKDVAEEHNDAKFDKAEEKDAQFLVDAADISMKVIKLSDMAPTQAEAADIKELAAMLKDDESKSLKEIEAMASKKTVTLPTEPGTEWQTDYNQIVDKQGKGFDQKYSSMLVDLHKDAIDKFEKASTDCQDYEIKSWAGKKLKELRADLDKSMVCHDKYEDKDHKDSKEVKKMEK